MIKTIRVVYNSDNKKVFGFPIDTLLDHIIPDLWHDIIRYMNCEIFIGNSTTKYHGFRSMKKEEFNGKQIMDYYWGKSLGTFMKINCEFIDLVIGDYFIQSEGKIVSCYLGKNKYDKTLFSAGDYVIEDDCEIYVSDEIADAPPYYTFFVPNI